LVHILEGFIMTALKIFQVRIPTCTIQFYKWRRNTRPTNRARAHSC